MVTETARVDIPVMQIRHALRHSPETFIQFFLAEDLTFPVPDFHKEVFFEMTHAEVNKLVMAIPRGHAKTTLAKLAAVWYLLFTEFRFVLYVSGSHDLVVPYVNDIANFFRSPNFVSIFGQVEWQIDRDGTGEYKFYIKSLRKMCILKGLGAGHRTRGVNVDNERPQLAICDDLEDVPDVETLVQHKKMLKWFFGSFRKCLNPTKNKLIVAGNLLAKQSVLYKLLQRKNWRSFLYGAIKEDKLPLWQDVWSIQALREDYEEYLDLGLAAQWFAEMMNQPTAEGGNIIDATDIAYRAARVPEDVAYGYVTIDPAISKQRWADNAAVGVQGWIEELNMWQVLEYEFGRGLSPTDLFWISIKLAKKWGVRVIGIERAAMQEALEVHFNLLLTLNRMADQFEIVMVGTGNVRKAQRIITWASGLSSKNGKVPSRCLTYGDFMATQQLLNYEPSKAENDDDIIDMLAAGCQMERQYLGKIMQKFDDKPEAQTQTTYQVSQV